MYDCNSVNRKWSDFCDALSLVLYVIFVAVTEALSLKNRRGQSRKVCNVISGHSHGLMDYF